MALGRVVKLGGSALLVACGVLMGAVPVMAQGSGGVSGSSGLAQMVAMLLTSGGIGVGLKYAYDAWTKRGDRDDMRRKSEVDILKDLLATTEARRLREEEAARAEVGQLRGEARALDVVCDRQRRELEDRVGRLTVENQQLRSERVFMQQALDQERAGSSPLFTPNDLLTVEIVSDGDGKILRTTMNTDSVFHWAPDQLVGRNVRVLIPKEMREAHDKGLAAARAAGGVSRQGMLMSNLRGLTRDGETFPILMNLTSYKSGTQIIFSATIRRKWQLENTGLGPMSADEIPVALPVPVPALAPPAPAPAGAPEATP